MLTDVKIRKAGPAGKEYKLADGHGLYLLVKPNGSKLWRAKYRFEGREKKLSIGPYPEVSLQEARDTCLDARRALRAGVDPGKRAKLAPAGRTLESVAREWHQQNRPRWAPIHAQDVIRSLERDVFPAIGGRAIESLDPATILETLRVIEKRGAIETARRIRQRLSDIFDHAFSLGLTEDNPADRVKKAMAVMPKAGRQAALTNIDDIRGLMRAVEGSTASPVVIIASRLIALTAVRSAVARGARWDEFQDLDGPAPYWHIPAARMKLKLDRKSEATFDHIVPLPRQAVASLEALRPLTGHLDLLFPCHRSTRRPISENAVGFLYNRLGYQGRHCPHGWRASFSTIMNESAQAAGRASDRSVIDLMLSHMPKDKVESAYNRAQYMERRREIVQEWANLIM